MFTLSYWSLSDTETDLIAVCLDILNHCCVEEATPHQCHHCDLDLFFQEDTSQQIAPPGSLDGLKGGAYAKGEQFCSGQKGPRSLHLDGQGILITTY